jgi:glutamate formiminotransferase
MIPVAYAGGDDDDGNKNKTEDDSAAAIADCDHNDVEQAGFDCEAIAANDIDIDLGEDIVLGFVDGIPLVYLRN